MKFRLSSWSYGNWSLKCITVWYQKMSVCFYNAVKELNDNSSEQNLSRVHLDNTCFVKEQQRSCVEHPSWYRFLGSRWFPKLRFTESMGWCITNGSIWSTILPYHELGCWWNSLFWRSLCQSSLSKAMVSWLRSFGLQSISNLQFKVEQLTTSCCWLLGSKTQLGTNMESLKWRLLHAGWLCASLGHLNELW